MESKKWSELFPDLLSLILLKLALPDHLRFASVCTSWASAASELRRRRPTLIPQFPWLMFLDASDPSAAKFYSVSDKKVYTIRHFPDPQISRRLFLGSAHGWVVTVDERSEPLLLNPITRAQIPLPSVTTLPEINPVLHSDGSLTGYTVDYGHSWNHRAHTLDDLCGFLYEKVILSAPPDGGGCIAVLHHNPGYRLAFSLPGDGRWTVLEASNGVDNAAFHGGLLYSVNARGQVHAYDLRDPSPKPTAIVGEQFRELSPRFFFRYLVTAPCGDLLTVWRERDYDEDNDPHLLDFKTTLVLLFKVDINNGRLVEMKSLGDYSVFVGANVALCLSTKDVPGLRANCIYFTDEDMERSYDNRDHYRDIGIYDLENGSIESILRSDTRLYWPPPIWLMPNIF